MLPKVALNTISHHHINKTPSQRRVQGGIKQTYHMCIVCDLVCHCPYKDKKKNKQTNKDNETTTLKTFHMILYTIFDNHEAETKL